jgi:hypothetical protein
VCNAQHSTVADGSVNAWQSTAVDSGTSAWHSMPVGKLLVQSFHQTVILSQEYCTVLARIVVFSSNLIILHNRGTGNLHFNQHKFLCHNLCQDAEW